MPGKTAPNAAGQHRNIDQSNRTILEPGQIPFVDTEAAARYLALEAQTLRSYRAFGGGPVSHKFGSRVRYAIHDLDAWAARCRRTATSDAASATLSPKQPIRRWPPPEILRRARFVGDAGPVRFVDTGMAARHLSLEAHTLECYRSVGGGPAYHKFGKWVRYAFDDLDNWATGFPQVTTSAQVSAIKSPMTPPSSESQVHLLVRGHPATPQE